MVTDTATSPRARYETTFDAVPPGAQPTRITPAAISGGSCISHETSTATPGITTYCASTPTAMGTGRFATSAKSAGRRVRPIPNITSPSRVLVQGAAWCTVGAKRYPASPPASTRTGNTSTAT